MRRGDVHRERLVHRPVDTRKLGTLRRPIFACRASAFVSHGETINNCGMYGVRIADGQDVLFRVCSPLRMLRRRV